MNKKLNLLSVIFIILITVSIVLIVKDNKKEVVYNTENKIDQIEKNNNIIVEDKKTETDNNIIIEKKIESKIPFVPKKQEEVILFYGDGCPHCEIVDAFIKENKIDEKISVSHKEVYYNRDNSNELVSKAKICGFDTNSIGVPFLWDGAKCLVGDQDIIEFFKLKTIN